MKIVVISELIEQKHVDEIKATAGDVGAEVCFVTSESDIPDEFKSPDVVYGFGMNTAKNEKNLKWLCVPSAGVDFLMKPGMFANEDCLITNSSGSYGVSIAEHIFTVTLMMMRKYVGVFEETSRSEWGTPRKGQRSIWGSRITVLGTGDIGLSFARRARGFEPENIIGVSRSGICDDPCFDKMMKVDELDKVLPETDLLVMSLPDTKETRNILNRDRIMSLPEGAFIVNVGRGSAIDEDALADALDSGRLAGAALDVFRTEPLPKDNRLWNTRGLVVTPHVAGNLTLAYTVDKNVEMFCEDLRNFAAGKPLKYLVDRKKGY